MLVTVRYFAGAAAAAGVQEERVDVEPGTTLTALLRTVAADRPRLEPVLTVASVLVDEVPVRERGSVLTDGAAVDVLPPFAGG